MEKLTWLELPFPVWLALAALIAGLLILARQLYALRVPTAVAPLSVALVDEAAPR